MKSESREDKNENKTSIAGQIGAVEIVSTSKLALEPWNLELMPALEKGVRNKNAGRGKRGGEGIYWCLEKKTNT